MTQEEIMEKAIEKAQKNGYEHDYFEDKCYVSSATTNGILWEAIIFSQDFAKAFWFGEIYSGFIHGEVSPWQHHLQQMVLEKDPIKYLEKFI